MSRNERWDTVNAYSYPHVISSKLYEKRGMIKCQPISIVSPSFLMRLKLGCCPTQRIGSLLLTLRRPGIYRRPALSWVCLIDSSRIRALNAKMTSTTSSPPPITHILETCLYVRSITKSVDFYKSVLGLDPFLETVSLLSLTPSNCSMPLLSSLSASSFRLSYLSNSHASPASLSVLQHFCSSNLASRLRT